MAGQNLVLSLRRSICGEDDSWSSNFCLIFNFNLNSNSHEIHKHQTASFTFENIEKECSCIRKIPLSFYNFLTFFCPVLLDFGSNLFKVCMQWTKSKVLISNLRSL